MTTIDDVTDETFQAEVMSAPGVVLVDFWAPWCKPCRQIGPVIDELARELDGRVKVVKINTDDNPTVADALKITSIPTLLIVSNGTVVATLVGPRPKAAIREALTGHVAA